MTFFTVVTRGLMRRPVRTGLTIVGIAIGIAAVVALVLVPVGLGFGLVLGITRPADRPPSPRSSLGSDRLAAIVTLATGSVAFAPVFGVFTLLGGGPAGVPGGIALGLFCGVPIALGMTAARPWSAYRLAHAALAARGMLPWRLPAFLEDARRLGILRQVGAVYQFRHARLQDRLAAVVARHEPSPESAER